ncbi:CoA pyrophosphatase [Oricola sp.]|uniref:CoA pyrophosphatase n=1 Tax=Oricola sp. TaxID=1979950 RepID=UPI003BACB027
MSVNGARFTIGDFRERASTAAPDVDPVFGDHILNPEFTDLVIQNAVKEAAVLIPIIDRPDGPSVLLTQRTEHLRTHSGQIAFPGGRIDPEDGTAEFAAIRECEEETGIGRDHVEIVGRLPDYIAGSGFRIAPFLSVLRPGYNLVPNPDEVEAVFDVPLAFLMDTANHRHGSRVLGGKERHYYEMPYGERYIWGITAGIIRMMYERLYR